MRRLLATFVLCAYLTVPASAEEPASPETLRAAQDLAAIMTVDSIQRMSNIMTQQMWPQIEAQFAGRVDGGTLAELRGEFEQSLTSFTSDVMKDAPAIYARYFGAQELRDMTAFYKSPTGAKALQTMPKVMGDVMGQMMPRMQAFQDDMKSRVAAVMRKHGYKD